MSTRLVRALMIAKAASVDGVDRDAAVPAAAEAGGGSRT